MDERHEPDPGGAAREEIARQAVWLVAMLIAIPVVAWLERKAHQPDAWRTARMMAARKAERALAECAGAAWRAAEQCRLAYERERG